MSRKEIAVREITSSSEIENGIKSGNVWNTKERFETESEESINTMN